jgi:long-chain acyl-CoA synthetase
MILGGRMKTIMCGGAVLSEDTQRFVQAALCVTLFQGYGLTETCAAATVADCLFRTNENFSVVQI